MLDYLEVAKRLRKIALFAPLSSQEAYEVLQQCQIALYMKNKIIFREDQHGDSLMVILQGSVILSCAAPEGVNVEIATLEEGAVLGEMALLTPGNRAATATAAENSVLVVIGQDTLESLIAENHPAASQILRYLLDLQCRRFRKMDERIEQVFMNRLEEDIIEIEPIALWPIQ